MDLLAGPGQQAHLIIAVCVHEVGWVGLKLQASMNRLRVVVCKKISSTGINSVTALASTSRTE